MDNTVDPIEIELDKLYIKLIKKYNHTVIRESFLSYFSKRFDSSLHEGTRVASEKTNLAIFSKQIKDVKEISSCLLFFSTIDESTDNGLKCYCIFCKEQVQLVLKPTVSAHKLMEHISHHFNINRFISNYPKIGNLLYSVDFNSYFMSDGKLKRSQQASIENMFQPNDKRRKKGEGERVVIDLCPGKLE